MPPSAEMSSSQRSGRRTDSTADSTVTLELCEASSSLTVMLETRETATSTCVFCSAKPVLLIVTAYIPGGRSGSENSPDALVGRIASTGRMIALGLAPIGSVIGGVLIDAIGGTATLAVLGASMCVLAVTSSQVSALRDASLAPRVTRGPEPALPVFEDL